MARRGGGGGRPAPSYGYGGGGYGYGGGDGGDGGLSAAQWRDWREAYHALLVTSGPHAFDLQHAPSMHDFTRGIGMCERAERWAEAAELIQRMRRTWLH